MELPDIVRESLGEEDPVSGLRLGDEDMVVFTPTRAVLYRGEGLLSDEALSTFGFAFERLRTDWGRRKVTFTLEYMDDRRELSVPKDRGDRVLERLIEGTLRVREVLDPDEAVTGVYRFSELTLAIAERRLLKHVGGTTWAGDFEVFEYGDLTRLGFEEGSVATQVVLGTESGRTDRIKAPNQEAGAVRKSLQEAVFAHYGVDSLEALNREIEPAEPAEPATEDDGLEFDSGIDPLVGTGDPDPGSGDDAADAGGSATESILEDPADLTAGAEAPASQDADIAAVTAQLEELTAAVERQNELLASQRETVRSLIEELRR